MPLQISNRVAIPDEQIELSGIRAQGPGGQHVNKASTAVQLRFDIRASSLPEWYKRRLMDFGDSRISREGVVVIKAQRYRSREQNRDDALERLRELIARATTTRKKRIATRPTRKARQKRLEDKTRRGKIKSLRGKVSEG